LTVQLNRIECAVDLPGAWRWVPQRIRGQSLRKGSAFSLTSSDNRVTWRDN